MKLALTHVVDTALRPAPHATPTLYVDDLPVEAAGGEMDDEPTYSGSEEEKADEGSDSEDEDEDEDEKGAGAAPSTLHDSVCEIEDTRPMCKHCREHNKHSTYACCDTLKRHVLLSMIARTPPLLHVAEPLSQAVQLVEHTGYAAL